MKTTRKITNRRELRTGVLRSFTFLSIAGGTGIYTRFCGKRNTSTFHASKVRVWSLIIARARVCVRFTIIKKIKKRLIMSRGRLNCGFSFRYRIRNPSPPLRSRLENRARQIAFKSANDRAITFDRSLLSRGRDSFFPFMNEGGTPRRRNLEVLGELETPRTYISYARVFSRAFFPFSLFFLLSLLLFSLFQIALKINWHPGARSG